MRHGFVDEKALITTASISSCHQKLCTFCLLKKKPEDAFLTRTVNYRKILHKKQTMSSKTTV